MSELDSGKSLFRTGLVSVTFRESGVEDVLRAVEKAGLEGIEWGADRHVRPGDVAGADRLRRQMEDLGIVASAYGSYYRFEEALGLASANAEFAAVLDSADALGAEVIRVWAGEKGSDATSAAESKAIVDRCVEIAAMAEERNIGIGFEFHSNTAADTPESTMALLKSIDRKNVSSFWQTPLEMSPEERRNGLKVLLPHVSNVHCNSFGQNPWPGIHELAEGEEEWQSYLDLLASSRLPRWISIEFVKGGTVEQLCDDAVTLRRWLRAFEAK